MCFGNMLQMPDKCRVETRKRLQGEYDICACNGAGEG